MIKKKVLVLYAHPSQARSEVNQPMFVAAQKLDGVTSVDLYGEYPTFNINVEKEQCRLLEHDVMVFQFPLFWYSTPAILKEWQDLVLEYGFAYGGDGRALRGKYFLCALSAGGKEEAYQTEGFMHYTIRELLLPLEQLARLTGMEYLPPFALFGARTATEDGRIGKHILLWEKALRALMQDEINPEEAREAELFNTYLKELPAGGAL